MRRRKATGPRYVVRCRAALGLAYCYLTRGRKFSLFYWQDETPPVARRWKSLRAAQRAAARVSGSDGAWRAARVVE